MSHHDDLVILRHMLGDPAQEAVNLTRGRVRGDLDANRLLELSLVRLLEIIGEADNRVSPDLQSRYPHIRWSQIVSSRHLSFTA